MTVTHSFKELEDNALLSMALDQNQKAWQELVRRYYTKIMSTVCRIYGYKSESEDIVQEIFIELAKSVKNFRHDSSFSTFLYRIAVNTTYRYIKRNKSASFVSDSLDFLSGVFSEDQHEPSAQDSMITSENATVVNEALKKLSPEKRAALVLFEVEGLTLKEIAEILKVPLQTVWSRVYNGRRDMLKILKENKS